MKMESDNNISCLVRPEIQILLQMDLPGGKKSHSRTPFKKSKKKKKF